MKLPKLDTPIYTLTLPSTKEEVKFRPFLVKEEKILLLAQESENPTEIVNNIKSVISSCTFGTVDPEKLAIYDLEYIFIQLRAKSVGENAEVAIKCESCGHPVNLNINLGEVAVKFPETEISDKIQLSDKVGIKLKNISIQDSLKLDSLDLIGAIVTMIDYIYDEENVYAAADSTVEELSEFVEGLSHSHLESFQLYIENQPKLRHTVNFVCPKCQHKNTKVIEGLHNFFM